MSRDKQIEEMADEIYETLMLEAECPLSGMDCAIIADLLVGKGYRKDSEVVLEVIGEIEEGVKAAISALQFENNPIHRKVKHETYSSLMRFIKTIEKKHTESEKDNE